MYISGYLCSKGIFDRYCNDAQESVRVKCVISCDKQARYYAITIGHCLHSLIYIAPSLGDS